MREWTSALMEDIEDRLECIEYNIKKSVDSKIDDLILRKMEMGLEEKVKAHVAEILEDETEELAELIHATTRAALTKQVRQMVEVEVKDFPGLRSQVRAMVGAFLEGDRQNPSGEKAQLE